MIEVDTLFILGAGASKPYGFPTAYELRNLIINKYEVYLNKFCDMVKLDHSERVRLLIKAKEMIIIFEKSSVPSIDLFLTRNRDKLDINKGIPLIWMFIMWYERNSKLSSQIEENDEDWYYEFFNELTGDIKTREELDNLPKEKIHFITFNYDRSLENYLFVSFMNSFSLSEKETSEILDKHFCFKHVYGKVANFDWGKDTSNTSPYKDPNGVLILRNANKMINILYNERKLDSETQDLIKSKRKIVFLGFGFAKENIDFLDLKESLTTNHVIYATGIGLYGARILKIKSLLQRGIVGIKEHNIIIEPESNSLTLLRNRIF